MMQNQGVLYMFGVLALWLILEGSCGEQVELETISARKVTQTLQKTSSCSEWTYGDDCSNNCICHKERSVNCNSTAGQCLCRPGYTRPDCSEECPFGTYGDGCSNHCSNCTTGLCHHVNGSCKCYGKKGENCTEECENDKFGIDCSSPCMCNNHHSNGSCDPCSGTCYCYERWTGPKCDIECPAMLDCVGCQSLRLFNKCNPYTFSWSCRAGWTGELCDTVCQSGLFGEKCSQVCVCNETSQDCNPVTGECVCKPGRTGDLCEHSPNEFTGMSSEDEMVLYIAAACGAFLVVAATAAFVTSYLIKKRRQIRVTEPEVELPGVEIQSTAKPENDVYCNDNVTTSNEACANTEREEKGNYMTGRIAEPMNKSENAYEPIHLYELGNEDDERKYECLH